MHKRKNPSWVKITSSFEAFRKYTARWEQDHIYCGTLSRAWMCSYSSRHFIATFKLGSTSLAPLTTACFPVFITDRIAVFSLFPISQAFRLLTDRDALNCGTGDADAGPDADADNCCCWCTRWASTHVSSLFGVTILIGLVHAFLTLGDVFFCCSRTDRFGDLFAGWIFSSSYRDRLLDFFSTSDGFRDRLSGWTLSSSSRDRLRVFLSCATDRFGDRLFCGLSITSARRRDLLLSLFASLPNTSFTSTHGSLFSSYTDPCSVGTCLDTIRNLFSGRMPLSMK